MGSTLVVSSEIYFCLIVDGLYSADLNCSCSSGVYAFSGDEGDAWGYWW